jgi:hypothetical protein
MVEAMPELFVETVSKSARKNLLPSFRNIFQIVVAELGDSATVKGAAAWAAVATAEADGQPKSSRQEAQAR